MSIIDSIKKGLQRMGAETRLGREYKTIWEIDGIPAFRQFYDFSIFPAKYIYRGFYKPWHVIQMHTIANQKATRNLYRMDIAKAVCAELAGLIWSEGADIHVTFDGDDDYLQRFVDMVLDKNAFGRKMQEHIEQSAALGGGAIKEYVTMKRDEQGKPIKGTEKICLDYCMADQFIPTSWDNAEVSEAVFVSRKAKDGYYYTRLEWHKWNGETYTISNDLFRAPMKNGDGNDQDILGFRYPLADIYPYIAKQTLISGLGASLFAYYRTPQANNVDDNSPLGISIYGNAFDTLHALDICYDSLVREFRLGKRTISVPASAVRTVVDPQTGAMVRYFDANDEAYQAFSLDENAKIEDRVPELRVEEHVHALNALLSVLCLQVGFSASTFSFDLANGLKTATEVISENSKTYKTIRNFQQQLIPCIERTVRNIIELAKLYDMEFDGRKIASVGDYEVSVVTEDAVLEDSSSKLDRGIKLMANGLLAKKTVMTDPKYGIGMTEEEADAELQKIAAETTVGATAVDWFGNTQET